MTFEVKYDKIYNVKDRYLYKTEQKIIKILYIIRRKRKMTQKNLEKLERKKRRYHPIPYTRKGKTKKDIINRIITKYKKDGDNPSF